MLVLLMLLLSPLSLTRATCELPELDSELMKKCEALWALTGKPEHPLKVYIEGSPHCLVHSTSLSFTCLETEPQCAYKIFSCDSAKYIFTFENCEPIEETYQVYEDGANINRRDLDIQRTVLMQHKGVTAYYMYTSTDGTCGPLQGGIDVSLAVKDNPETEEILKHTYNMMTHLGFKFTRTYGKECFCDPPTGNKG